MLTWLLRLVFLVVVVRLLWRLLRSLLAAADGARRSIEHGGTLVRDPVCGTFVVPSRALTARRGGVVHYFCSEACRQAFAHSPAGRVARR
jgi:uncharacterized protein